MKYLFITAAFLFAVRLSAQEKAFKVPVDAEVMKSLIIEIVEDDRTKLLRRAPTEFGQGVFFIINTDMTNQGTTRQDVGDIEFAMLRLYADPLLDTNIPVEITREEDKRPLGQELSQTAARLFVQKREDKLVFTIRTQDVAQNRNYQYTAIADAADGKWKITDINEQIF